MIMCDKDIRKMAEEQKQDIYLGLCSIPYSCGVCVCSPLLPSIFHGRSLTANKTVWRLVSRASIATSFSCSSESRGGTTLVVGESCENSSCSFPGRWRSIVFVHRTHAPAVHVRIPACRAAAKANSSNESRIILRLSHGARRRKESSGTTLEQGTQRAETCGTAENQPLQIHAFQPQTGETVTHPTPPQSSNTLYPPAPRHEHCFISFNHHGEQRWSEFGTCVCDMEQRAIASSLPAPGLPRSLLQCGVCLSLVCEPVSISCGHTFCRTCLVSSLRRSHKRCPCCRAVCHTR